MTALEAACARSGWGLHRRSDQDRPHGSTERGLKVADSMGRGHRTDDHQPAQEVPQGGMQRTRPLRYPHRYPCGKSRVETAEFCRVRCARYLTNDQFADGAGRMHRHTPDPRPRTRDTPSTLEQGAACSTLTRHPASAGASLLCFVTLAVTLARLP